jgi:ABC-2 type transport system permease protein
MTATTRGTTRGATRGTTARSIAFARRAWQQQRSTAVWLAAVIGALLGVLVATGSGAVDTTGLDGLVPAQGTGLVTVHDTAGDLLPMTTYLLTMTPAMLGMLVAIVATLTLPGVTADDVRGGGIEVLLAGPVPRRALFQSYLGAGLLLTAASWLVATVAFAVTAAVAFLVTDTTVTLTPAFGVALVAVPFAMAVWSATATLLGALLYPGSLETTAGMNGGPIRLLALLPAMIAVPTVLLLPGWVLPALGLVLAFTVLASVAVVALTARGFRSTKVLSA